MGFRKVIKTILPLVALAILLSACGKSVIEEYAAAEIVISGLTDSEFVITPRELLAMETVSRTATGETQKAGTVGAEGPLLETFLAEYGCKPTDFAKIRFIAYDEYKTTLRNEYLTDFEVIMAVSSGDKPLAEVNRPLRLLIPGAESHMWIYGVVRIEFERAA